MKLFVKQQVYKICALLKHRANCKKKSPAVFSSPDFFSWFMDCAKVHKFNLRRLQNLQCIPDAF